MMPPVILASGGTYDEMWDAAKAAGDPLATVEQVEELFRYDGIMVDVVRDGTGQVWLRIVADEDDPGGHETRHIVVTNHFLAFDSVDAAKATVHGEGLQTIEGYVLADSIVEQVISYDTVVGGSSSGHEYRSRRIWLDRIPEDHLPFRQLLPGRRMRFGPLADPLELTDEESSGLYRYPVPQDEVVVFHDCVRSWIGTFPDQKFQQLIHMVACMRDDDGIWVQHRLGFAVEDEAEFRATLAAGQAPTMATYLMAKEIRRETIDTRDPGNETLTVEDIDADSLGDEAPTYRDAAHHDQEWPDFAAKRKD